MRIISATIYGFGKWIDYTIDFHPEGYTCIYGENESGKSTLHQFVLFMLFGLPPKQRQFYRPKTSGKLGGRLTVEVAGEGTFIIERMDEVNNGAAVCYTNDGKAYDEDWLQARLKGITKKTYQSIFSFSSTDLHMIHNMKEDDLAEVLLGIGMTGSNAIYAAEKRLDDQTGELYKPKGTKPLINKQLTTLDNLHTQLRQAKDTEDTYKGLKENQTYLQKEISEYQERIGKERKALKMIEKEQQALPYIKEYLMTKEKLRAFPHALYFPEQGIPRLEKIKDKLLPLRSEQSILQENQHKVEQKMKTLQQQVDEFPWDQVNELLQKKGSWELRNKEFKQHEESIQKVNIKIKHEMDLLDVAVSYEELEELHLPFHIERAWQDLKESNETFRLEREKTEQEIEELDRQEQFVKQEKTQLEAEILPEHHQRELQEKIRSFQEQSLAIKWKKNAVHQKAQLEKKQKRANGMLTGSISAGLVAGITGFFLDTPMLYFLMMTFFVFGIIIWYSERKSSEAMAAMLQQDMREIQTQNITAEEVEEAAQLLSRNDNLLFDWRALEDQEKNLNLQRIKWEEKRNFMNERYNRLQEQIDAQMDKYPFLAHLEIRFWPEMYHRLKHIVQLSRDKQNIRQEMTKITEENMHFQEALNTYFDCDKKLPLETMLEKLEENRESSINKQKQIAYFKDQLQENAQSQDRLKRQLQFYENERTALLDSAAVSTEDDFYEKAKQMEEQAKYKKEKWKAIEQLNRILPEADRERLLHDVPEESSLIDRKHRTNTAVEKLEASLEQKRNELARIDAELAQLEASESYSSLMHQVEMEKEELNHLAKKWAVLKTAKEMLLETKRNYRDKYLHKVMNKTTDYFAKLTGGGYTKVFAPDRQNSFYVVASDLSRYHVNELSRGTIDQLYVSLRLAISDIMSKEYRIPFIIDDAFIHFDGVRTKRMMELLHDISGSRQMIVFTCKKEIANLAPPSQTIQLELVREKEVLSAKQ